MHFSLNDVWNSGNLARRSIERWVVPMLGNEDVGTHLGNHKSVINLNGTGIPSRVVGNTRMLRYFKSDWEQDLWFSDQDSPPLRGFLPFRHWISENIILGLHSVKLIRDIVGDFKMKVE